MPSPHRYESNILIDPKDRSKYIFLCCFHRFDITEKEIVRVPMFTHDKMKTPKRVPKWVLDATIEIAVWMTNYITHGPAKMDKDERVTDWPNEHLKELVSWGKGH